MGGAQNPRPSRSATVPLDLMRQPGHLARRLQQSSYLLWSSIVSDDVTAPQLVVLSVLAGSPGIDQRTLGEHASLDRSTVADIVSRLVRRGLLERLRDPADRRRNVLQLTDDGRATLARLAPRTTTLNRVLLAPLDLDEQEALLHLLGRLVEAGDRLRAKGP